MAIRLKWKNPNTGTTVVRIYRSATPIDTAALPDPVAEFSDGTTSYLDEFPKYGEQFYYMFSVTANGRTLFSPNKLYACVIDLGPGPQDIVLGDFKMGYFGKVTPFELGFASSIYPNGNFSTLHKFARNGKILYLPLTVFSATAQQLITAKVFTSGVNARNDPNAGAGGMIREFKNRLYAMRVAKMWDEDNLDVAIANYQPSHGPGAAIGVSAPMGKSEFVDIYRMASVSNPLLPTRFSFNLDNHEPNYTYYGVCDFHSSTAIVSLLLESYNIRTSQLRASSYGFSTAHVFYPVIEYKGLA